MQYDENLELSSTTIREMNYPYQEINKINITIPHDMIIIHGNGG